MPKRKNYVILKGVSSDIKPLFTLILKALDTFTMRFSFSAESVRQNTGKFFRIVITQNPRFQDILFTNVVLCQKGDVFLYILLSNYVFFNVCQNVHHFERFFAPLIVKPRQRLDRFNVVSSSVLYEPCLRPIYYSSCDSSDVFYVSFGDCYTDISVAEDRKSTRLNSSHVKISYAVFCLKKKK